MSSCDNSNIRKNYIVQGSNEFDIISACTGVYTNNLYNCTGDTLTINSDIVSANTINSSVYLSGGTNLLDIFTNIDTFVTGTTFSSNQAIVTRNDGVEVFKLSGTSSVTLTNPSSNQIVIDASGVKYFISETTPTGTLGNGYRWFNTSIGSEFVYIDDGDSSQWVQPLIQPGPQGPRGYSGTFITSGITTSTATLTTDYTYYGVNYAGNVDLTLPDPTGIDGVNIMIKDESGGATLNRIRIIASVGLIDGNSFVDISNNYQAYFIVARNNNWWII